jgi:hypothetical protein
MTCEKFQAGTLNVRNEQLKELPQGYRFYQGQYKSWACHYQQRLQGAVKILLNERD